jgi:micrococcal nuclease
MKYVTAATAIIVLAFAIAFARPVKVVKVLDGDTVRLDDGELVRLVGIDTPERGESLCVEATTFLARLVTDREVDLQFDYTRRDHYKRLLGYLWLGDTLVNKYIVAHGYARVYAWPPDTLHFRSMVAAQTEARRKHLGIWALPLPAPESLYVIHAPNYRFHRPNCGSVKRSDSTTDLSRDSLLSLGFAPCRTCKP